MVDREGVRGGLGSLRLLDARAGARYRGEIEPIDAYPGHIPTAISAPTDGNLAADGRFLSPAELAARYRGLGADGSMGDVVVSCGSGVSATHDALAMRIAGLPDARPISRLVQRLDAAGLAGRDGFGSGRAARRSGRLTGALRPELLGRDRQADDQEPDAAHPRE